MHFLKWNFEFKPRCALLGLSRRHHKATEIFIKVIFFALVTSKRGSSLKYEAREAHSVEAQVGGTAYPKTREFKMKLSNLQSLLIISSILRLPLAIQCLPKTVSGSDYSLNIESRHLCLRPGGQLDISCGLYYSGSRNDSMVYENWALVWYHDGKTLSGTTLISNSSRGGHVMNRVITANSSGQFTCVSRNQESVWQNRSVFVKSAPKAVEQLQQKPEYKYKNDYLHILISWRSSNHGDYSYELVHWWSSFQGENITSLGVTCDSSICNGFFATGGTTFENVSFYIITRTGAGCEAKSPVWTFFVADGKEEAEGEENVLLLLPQTPDHLYITTAFRKVTLKWDPDEQYYYYSAYSYQYNSSRSQSIKRETKEFGDVVTQTLSIELTNMDIDPYIPYKEYTFCIQLQWYTDSPYSKPRCNTSRLHEDIPTAAPTITCTSETCPMTDDGDERNMTITWKSPTEENRNGVLNELKLIYYSSDPDISEVVSIRNFDESSATLRGLSLTKEYTVSMKACTREGCSDNGNSVLIGPAEAKTSSSNVNNFLTPFIAVAGCILFLVIAVLIFVYVLRPPRCRFVQDQLTAQLPNISPPDPNEHIYYYPNQHERFDQLKPYAKEDDINANAVQQFV